MSKIDVFKKNLTNASVDVINKISADASGSIDQHNSTEISGNSFSFFNVNQTNDARVNVSALANSSISGDLQTQLIAKIKDEIVHSADTLGLSVNMTSAAAIIETTVKTEISNSTMALAASAVDQSNTFKASDNTKTIVLSGNKNSAVAITSVITNATTDIANKIATENDFDSQIKSSVTNPLSTLLQSGAFVMIAILVFVLLMGYGIWRLLAGSSDDRGD